MVVWVTGPFGVGKSTAAALAVAARPAWRVFDPEEVGFMLRASLGDIAVNDFQDLPPWRTLVPVCIDEVARFTRSGVLAVQTVLREEYWRELRAGLQAARQQTRLVVLTADEAVLRDRIRRDTTQPPGVRAWREAHVDAFLVAADARTGWLSTAADLVIDTSARSPEETAAALLPVLDRETVSQQ
ncbi:hypothetical protein KEM60_00436 [Austwickia sp. TVS 96-490-7B]|nr:hypothetical protein [Austwickia sp. TVS 96-490-7B]